MFEFMDGAEQAAQEIQKVYYKASRYLSHESDKIFERFRRKHSLTEAEARQLLNSLYDSTSIEALKKALEGASSEDKAAILAELESSAYQYRLERLRQLQNEIDRLMREVYQQERDISTSFYVDLANESYYKSIYDIQRNTGLGFSFNILDSKVVDQLLKSTWSGVNYSDRIWKNTQALARDLKEELLIDLLTGRTEREAAEILANKFGQTYLNARRLVRTESCYVAVQMDMRSYEDCGIDTYIFVATLDLRTSTVCRGLDGKRFRVSEQQPGKNCPPMHPWCRSTTICDVSDEDLAEMRRRARDPETGKTYTVPANMTYQEWYGKYVEKKTTSGIIGAEGEKLEMNLQLFAESDIKNQESASLKRAIRKYEKRIAEHEEYMKNPKTHCPDWDEKSVESQEGLKRHWQKEIRNFKQSIQDRVDELKKRGDYDG